MAVMKSLRGIAYIKKRPKAYRSAGYTVGGNRGFVVAFYPGSYPKTPQQQKASRVAAECGIRSGMGKSELIKAMKECVGPKMRK